MSAFPAHASTCCPKCGSSSIKLVHKKSFFDFLYTLVFQRPVRCRRCRHRFGAFYDPTANTKAFRKRVRKSRGKMYAHAVAAQGFTRISADQNQSVPQLASHPSTSFSAA